MPYKVRILLIDGDQRFQRDFCDSISSLVDNELFQIDTDNGDWEGERACAHDINHDIYVCGASIESSSVLDTIKTIKSKDPNGSIFVVSPTDPDSSLLKKILKLNVVGLIDRDAIEVLPLVTEIKSVAEAYTKVRSMVQKLNRLSSLKSVG